MDTTPKGTSFFNQSLTSGEYTPTQVAAWDAYWVSNYPTATLVSSSTYHYNCHGFVWGISYLGWCNAPDPNWVDGSYWLWAQGTGNFSQPICNDLLMYVDVARVLFYDDDGVKLVHSGMWDSMYFLPNGTMIAKGTSKWGPGPMMRHRFDAGFHPYFSPDLRAYRPYYDTD